jgi:hypothetical protein
MREKSTKKEIKIIKKILKNRPLHILISKDKEAIEDFMRFYYLKQGWKIFKQFKQTRFLNKWVISLIK